MPCIPAHCRRRRRQLDLTAALLSAVVFASCAKPTPVARPTPPVQPGPSVRRPEPVVRPAMHSIIPAPSMVDLSPGGTFVVGPDTRIVVPRGDERVLGIGQFLADLIGRSAAQTTPRVEIASNIVPPGSIHFTLGGVPRLGGEGYELLVTSDYVTVVANQPAGLFYGVQTLRHLLPAFVEYEAVRPDEARPVQVPAGRIEDRPRFGWRGAMLDVSRHFLDVDAVKRYLDLMALYKMNRLHLHLSDDQGWRIDITSWPNLARHGGSTQVGGGAGGYYTQDDYKAIVAYAAERFITVVPEIDMPGHTNAALASYPELNCDDVAPTLFTGIDVGFSTLCVDKEITYRFIDDVVREIAALTPGPYFHVGGDEVKKLSEAQYTAFVERVQDIVRTHGKRVIGWDEIGKASLRPGTIVQHWRPGQSPAVAVGQGAAVILSPASKTYLDMKYHAATALGLDWAGHIEVRDAYAWNPATLFGGVEASSILGVEAPLWSETLARLSDFEFMAFPRLAAVAEVAWSPEEVRTWDEFRLRLGEQAERWSALGLTFYRSADVPWVK